MDVVDAVAHRRTTLIGEVVDAPVVLAKDALLHIFTLQRITISFVSRPIPFGDSGESEFVSAATGTAVPQGL